jgi:hypothetical protein
MMNMFKLSEQLKDFSKDQLVREMKMPSGSVPQFLVLTELQRRTRMEREAQGGDAPEQSTVAQDAVAAAGVPQGGVAQMAQALAPKTDMAGNTGIAAMAPQAAPAPVQRMQEGGGIGDVPSIAEILAGAQENQSRAMLGPFETQYRRYLDQQADSLPSGVEAFDPRMTPDMQRTMRAMPEVSDAPTGLDDARPRIEGTTPARPFGAYADLLDAPTTAEQVFGDLPPVQGPPQQPRGEAERMADAVRRLEDAGLSREAIDSWVSSGADLNVLLTQLPPGTSTEEVEAMRPENIFRPATEAIEDVFAPDPLLPPTDETPAYDPRLTPEMQRIMRDMSGDETPADTETPTAPTAPDGGGGSRTGTLGDIDRMYEQDKWLSLARFGLGLMASSQPTLGGAIGEAGGAALDSLGQAREDLLQRRMAEAQLARRGGGGGGTEGGLDRRDLDLLETRMEMLQDRIMNAQTEGERLQAQTIIQRRLTSIPSFITIITPKLSALQVTKYSEHWRHRRQRKNRWT